ILADRLPPSDAKRLRFIGLGLAMIIRMLLLAVITWILKLDKTLFTVMNIEISGKGLILLAGGIFLLYKSTSEIYHKTELANHSAPETPQNASFGRLLMEVLLLDLVFSIDSIITAVGMVESLWVMYTAVVVTVIIMMFASGPISSFIKKHPSFKILALSFLMMIGVSLIAEGLHFEIPKGYIYFAMAFSFLVDVIQMKAIPASNQKSD
ncbi:MAG: TerC family protein, partial [Bacteroidetes bacterium]|nr:TerC family protein [Bacteroidota bacterium]